MVRRRLRLPVGPDRLWPILTEPGRASRWLGGRVDWTLQPGSPVRFTPDEGVRHRGRIDHVEPERQLRWTWWPEDEWEAASEVTWTLVPDGDGTELTVTETQTVIGTPPDPEGCRASASAAAASCWTGIDDRQLAAWSAQLRHPVPVA